MAGALAPSYFLRRNKEKKQTWLRMIQGTNLHIPDEKHNKIRSFAFL